MDAVRIPAGWKLTGHIELSERSIWALPPHVCPGDDGESKQVYWQHEKP